MLRFLKLHGTARAVSQLMLASCASELLDEALDNQWRALSNLKSFGKPGRYTSKDFVENTELRFRDGNPASVEFVDCARLFDGNKEAILDSLRCRRMDRLHLNGLCGRAEGSETYTAN